jgi:hypothetical protein
MIGHFVYLMPFVDYLFSLLVHTQLYVRRLATDTALG